MTKFTFAINNELNIIWRFIKSDIWATIIPGVIVTIVVISKNRLSTTEQLTTLVYSLVYFFLYVYSFVLTNQLSSIEEDRINKPFRPLPSNLVTVQQVKLRAVVAVILFILCGLILGIVQWAVLWSLTAIFHNFIGHRHWFTKNIVSMSLGIFAIIGAAWEMVSPLQGQALIWAITVSLVLGTCGVMQDFRDVNGDREMARKTLPIDLGDGRARLVSAFISAAAFIVIFLFVIQPARQSPPTLLFTFGILAMFILIPTRLLLFRDEKSDHLTYMFLLYQFNFILLSGLVYF